MSFGYNQYLYGNSSYRNPSLVSSYSITKNEEKQNLNQSSQFNIAGKMAISTTPINYHYIRRSPTPSQSTIQKNNSNVEVPKQNNLTDNLNKNFLGNYYNNANKPGINQYNNNNEIINRSPQYNNIYSNPITQRNSPSYNLRQNKNEELNRLTDQFEKMLISNNPNPSQQYQNNSITQNNNGLNINSNIRTEQTDNLLNNTLPQRNITPYKNQNNSLSQSLNPYQSQNQGQINPISQQLYQNPVKTNSLTQPLNSYQINNQNYNSYQPKIQNEISQPQIIGYKSGNTNSPNYYQNSSQKSLYQNSYLNSQNSNIYSIKTPYNNQKDASLNPWLQNLDSHQKTKESQIEVLKYSTYTKGGVSIDGRNKTNQDSSIAKSHSSTEYSFGVFDGHGPDGHFVSQAIKQYFESQPSTNLSSKENLTLTFNSLSKFIQSQKSFDVFNSGSTCVFVHITSNKIICGNCGDSRAIIISGVSNNVIQLSHDHKPELPEERKRIEQSGGRVDRVYGMGPYRVWMKNENYPGLAMSRSIGDGIAHNIGVSDLPEIIEFEIDKVKPLALIVASDGVWEFMTNEDVKNEISKFLYSSDSDSCAKSICEKARNFWEKNGIYCDDITAVVVFFKN